MPNHPPAQTTLIGAAEVALLLGVSRSTVSRRIRDGHLLPVKKLSPGRSGAYLFDPADILAYQYETGSQDEPAA